MAYVNISYFKVYRSVYFAVIPEICEMSKGILVYSEEGFRDVTDGEIRNNLLCTKCINIVSIFQYCLHQSNNWSDLSSFIYQEESNHNRSIIIKLVDLQVYINQKEYCFILRTQPDDVYFDLLFLNK